MNIFHCTHTLNNIEQRVESVVSWNIIHKTSWVYLFIKTCITSQWYFSLTSNKNTVKIFSIHIYIYIIIYVSSIYGQKHPTTKSLTSKSSIIFTNPRYWPMSSWMSRDATGNLQGHLISGLRAIGCWGEGRKSWREVELNSRSFP